MSVKEDVIRIIGECANMKKDSIKDEHVLGEHPLNLDDPQMMKLTTGLRSYVRTKNPDQNVTSSEIKKTLTVQQTYTVIAKKLSL